MNIEEVISMARQAGASPLHGGDIAIYGLKDLTRFANIVRESIDSKPVAGNDEFVVLLQGMVDIAEGRGRAGAWMVIDKARALLADHKSKQESQ